MSACCKVFQRMGLGVLIAVGGGALNGCATVSPPETVPFVDVERYMGTWYEIASFPTFFNRGLVNTTATYEIIGENKVSVFNRANKGAGGPETSIEGTARVVDRESNAKLSVSFSPIFPRLFAGQYWIVALDDEGYTWAVVTDSRKRTLFILSRTPDMDEALYDEIVEDLSGRDFAVENLNRTPQGV